MTTFRSLGGDAGDRRRRRSRVTASAFAQAQFRDDEDRQGLDAGQRQQGQPAAPVQRAQHAGRQGVRSAMPRSPRRPGVVVQRPRANLMGIVPITAGPTVPIVTLDSPSLQAIPGDRWVAPLYVTNNSGADDQRADRLHLHQRRPAGRRRPASIVPTAGPGERLASPVYGPRDGHLRRPGAVSRAHALTFGSHLELARNGPVCKAGPFLFG